MSPEQLEGMEADARTDVFGFGCVLYKMLSGRKAFQARSSASLLTAIMVSEPPPVSQLRSSIPAQVDAVIARCLRKNRDDRWQSAAELHDALAQIAPTAPSSQNVRWRWLTASALVTAVLVTADMARVASGRPARPARRSPQSRHKLPCCRCASSATWHRPIAILVWVSPTRSSLDWPSCDRSACGQRQPC